MCVRALTKSSSSSSSSSRAQWNANKTFTGWCDPDLSDRGYSEAKHCARLLLERGHEIDVVYTSRLKRSIRSAWEIMDELDCVYLPVYKSWRLNERHYGAFQGQSKIDLALSIGADNVQKYRGGLYDRPPRISESSAYYPGHDRRHADLTLAELPLTESLYDCMRRTSPLWEGRIKSDLMQGRNVMVVAHGNSLRGLVKMIEGINDDDIKDVAVPTGIPIVYRFDDDLNAVEDDESTNSDLNMTGIFEGATMMKGLFLEKPGLLRDALRREQEWKDSVPGLNATSEQMGQGGSITAAILQRPANIPTYTTVSKLERSLIKLEEVRNFNNLPQPLTALLNETGGAPLSNGYGERRTYDPAGVMPCVTPLPGSSGGGARKSKKSLSRDGGGGGGPIRKGAVIVIIRHGKTSHNKLGLFTGWEDAPLAEEGREEARSAGELLKKHGFEFDVVYTSWLSRAIETAWLVLDPLDSLWLPIIKSWRLNERMYGKLTGLSKSMVAQRHGQRQFQRWRRGYRDRPPAVSSFSAQYPGNDERYVKHLRDRRFSFRETLIRTVEGGKLRLHRKLPKSESLSDCMQRTLPFLTETIIPESVNRGKRVLISSSENAIRGILMHLCEIPEDRICDLEIPNGLPLIYDVNSRCVKLLDDGTGRNLMEVYDFGDARELLFRPCIGEDGRADEECDLTYAWPVEMKEDGGIGKEGL